MNARHPIPALPVVLRTPGCRDVPASARHAPRRNGLLAALPPADYDRLRPDLELVALPLDWEVHRSGDREAYAYFPIAGIVARLHELENGDTAEFAVTGSEGMIGIGAFLGGGSTPSRASVLIAGEAYRLRADVLQREFDRGGALLHLLLRYTQALIAQIGLMTACTRHHSVEQRLCRFLLSCLDRLPSDELALTQDRIAMMLGVRREGVTMALGDLQHAGVIDRARGHIAVLDRNRLEAQACECHAVIERAYARLRGTGAPGSSGLSDRRPPALRQHRRTHDCLS